MVGSVRASAEDGGTAGSGRVPVSIVCVYNDAEVLQSCLARSVREGTPLAPRTDFVPVDNRSGEFATAGAALNHGASRATNDVVVFVHQDVVLHSLPQLEVAAAALLASPDIGVLGAVGVDRRGRIVGRVRDRVVSIGRAAVRPVDVDSLDEVLFMVNRERLGREPIVNDPDLAWHAYAVEYGLRMRRAGLRSVAMDIPLTHNSLTTNLSRLDVAHRHVGDLYPEFLPIRTTCGVIRDRKASGTLRTQLRRGRGVAIWAYESFRSLPLMARFAADRVVLADIRLIVDEAAALGRSDSVRALELTTQTGIRTAASGLQRMRVLFEAATVTPPEADQILRARRAAELVVLTGLGVGDLDRLEGLRAQPVVVGFWKDVGLWVLVGAEPRELAALWPARRNRPFAGLVPIGRHDAVPTPPEGEA